MQEAWDVVNKFVLPFFNFIKTIINSVYKLFTGGTMFPEDVK